MSVTGTLAVPGAVLHHRTEGTGPLLLIAQSGEGDADRTVDLVPHLADAYTVLTYDRRGLSRSGLDHPERGTSLAEHADDVRRLLEAVADGPALMLGCSFGAVIGLHVAARRPGLLRTLVAHEPVAPGLLAPAEAARHRRELVDLQELYGRGGLSAVLPEMARVLGIDPAAADAEPGLTPQPLDARRAAGFDRFVRHDFTAVVADVLDLDAVRASGTRIVPAVGRTTPPGVFDRRCAQALGALLGAPVAELPGGHNGNTSHPRAWAARLKELFAQAG
ncbi:alpha/beta fold hydrolase [Kitasatospora phosalacinea]|uniref:alpha/beta fold hydrolase n=1 Tax=Kitasatospora phosalacinea TaxID=2065 RepID=UPI0035E0AAA7